MENRNVKKLNKEFDAVQFMRDQRDRISKDLNKRSPEEIIEYLMVSQMKGRVKPSA